MKKILLSAMVLATTGLFAQVKIGANPTVIDNASLWLKKIHYRAIEFTEKKTFASLRLCGEKK